MKLDYRSRMKMLRAFAIAADLAFLNVCLLLLLHIKGMLSTVPTTHHAILFFSWNVSYLVCIIILPPTIGQRSQQSADIARNCFRSGLIMVALHYIINSISGIATPPVWKILLVSAAVLVWMFCSRILSRALVRAFGSRRRIVFVGHSPTLQDLAVSMLRDVTSRYEMCGWFDDKESDEPFPLRRRPLADLSTWLAHNQCNELYCAMVDKKTARSIFDYCENHLIRFYAVPDSYWMLDMRMAVEMDGDIPIFTSRSEPLQQPGNVIVKRAFDLIVSSLVLLFLFPPILLFVAIMIKRQSPGPIFFTQWRDGADGRRFKCIKFRSMYADMQTDGRKATMDDPRKFPFGDFMRRKNIDELPQFVNVFLGNMSVVGPRPHATWTTDEYRDSVNKYMVRLYAKPGITGWAQVNGCRGETKTDDEMLKRVKMDVWYIGHWSFWLDLRIIVMTVANMFGSESGNAY